jgi:hypothetical protein
MTSAIEIHTQLLELRAERALTSIEGVDKLGDMSGTEQFFGSLDIPAPGLMRRSAYPASSVRRSGSMAVYESARRAYRPRSLPGARTGRRTRLRRRYRSLFEDLPPLQVDEEALHELGRPVARATLASTFSMTPIPISRQAPALPQGKRRPAQP